MAGEYWLPFHIVRNARPDIEYIQNIEIFLVIGVAGLLVFRAYAARTVVRDLLRIVLSLVATAAVVLPIVFLAYFLPVSGEWMLATFPLGLVSSPFVFGAIFWLLQG